MEFIGAHLLSTTSWSACDTGAIVLVLLMGWKGEMDVVMRLNASLEL